jgi:hypothetical protein
MSLNRVDDILSIYGVADVKYRQVMKETGSVLAKLVEIARELEEQRPELLQLVMKYEAATTMNGTKGTGTLSLERKNGILVLRW